MASVAEIAPPVNLTVNVPAATPACSARRSLISPTLLVEVLVRNNFESIYLYFSKCWFISLNVKMFCIYQGFVVFLILLVLLIWMICARTSRRRDSQAKAAANAAVVAGDPSGSQANFYYGSHAPYAESIAPSHHSTYAHYYDEEEDGWEMPNFYNETYMKGR
jgi:hypothetical protein